MANATLNVNVVGNIDKLVRDLHEVSEKLTSLEVMRDEILGKIANVASGSGSYKSAIKTDSGSKIENVGQKKRGRPRKNSSTPFLDSLNGVGKAASQSSKLSKNGKRLGRPPKNYQESNRVSNSVNKNQDHNAVSKPATTSNRKFSNGNTMSLKDAIVKVLSMSKNEQKTFVPDADLSVDGLKADEIKTIVDATKIWSTKNGNLSSMIQVELHKLINAGHVKRSENRRYSVVV